MSMGGLLQSQSFVSHLVWLLTVGSATGQAESSASGVRVNYTVNFSVFVCMFTPYSPVQG